MVVENLADTIDLTTVEAATSLLTNCAMESGLGEDLAARNIPLEQQPLSNSVATLTDGGVPDSGRPGLQAQMLTSGASGTKSGEPLGIHERLHREAALKQAQRSESHPPFSSVPHTNEYFNDPKGSSEAWTASAAMRR